jgi:hypothetical protein
MVIGKAVNGSKKNNVRPYYLLVLEVPTHEMGLAALS